MTGSSVEFQEQTPDLERMLEKYTFVSGNYEDTVIFYLVWNLLAILSYGSDIILQDHLKKTCNYFKIIFPAGIITFLLFLIMKRIEFANRVCLCIYRDSVLHYIQKGVMTYVSYNVHHHQPPMDGALQLFEQGELSENDYLCDSMLSFYIDFIIIFEVIFSGIHLAVIIFNYYLSVWASTYEQFKLNRREQRRNNQTIELGNLSQF